KGQGHRLTLRGEPFQEVIGLWYFLRGFLGGSDKMENTAKNGRDTTQRRNPMANSVNTNFGAIVALQSLSRTNNDLESAQKRVSTGYRVADAVDDGAAFAVAQGLRGDVKGFEAVSE